MKAHGEHLLIQKPSKKTITESGILLPDTVGQKYEYGRVLSVGELVDGVNDGDYVFFDPFGVREILADPLKDDGRCVAHASHIFATVTREELEERNLPIP